MSLAWLSAPADVKISPSLPQLPLPAEAGGAPHPPLQTALLALPGCREHGGARTARDNVSSGQREGISEWDACTIQLLARAVSCCGPDGDNNVAGKTILEKRHVWELRWGEEEAM